MASLSEVIRNVTSIVDHSTELMADLEWSTSRLRTSLNLCSHSEISKWRINTKRNYGSKMPHDHLFYEIQGRVDRCLESAARKCRSLRQWSKRPQVPIPNVLSCRHLVVLALRKVLQAFKHFCDLRGSPRGIAFEYIKRCYGFMIGLGQLLYPYGDGDNWFTVHTEFLDNDLPDFLLDGRKSRQVPKNPTLSGQLLDESEIPATYLPNWPEPPIAVRTQGPYGPALSRNLYCNPKETDVRVSFTQEAPAFGLCGGSDYSFSSSESVYSGTADQSNLSSTVPQFTSYFQEPTLLSNSETFFQYQQSPMLDRAIETYMDVDTCGVVNFHPSTSASSIYSIPSTIYIPMKFGSQRHPGDLEVLQHDPEIGCTT